MNVLKQFFFLIGFASAATAQSPYISRVYEYRPAPGQFVNTMPEYTEGDTEASMAQKAEECLANNKKTLISLGGYGGYVVFGFDHTIVNVEGEYDFKILGNAFFSDTQSPDDTRRGGSCEPGIVMVSRDANGNGLPDDTWYELAGSDYKNAATKHNYTMTYQRQAADHTPTPDPKNKAITDTKYIAWESSADESGFVYKNAYHKQNYYPDWISADKMSFTGTRLPDNAVDLSSNGTNYLLYMFDWGYADNHPNETNEIEHPSEFKIDWAVDANGNSVKLNGIDFVKVYTAINQNAGWLGEVSTEISGANDLHVDAVMPNAITEISVSDISPESDVFDLTGRKTSLTNAKRGIYIIKYKNGQRKKIILK